MANEDPDRALVDGLQSRDLCVMQLLISRKYHRIARFLTAVMPGRAFEAEDLAIKVLRTARDMIDSFDRLDIRFDTWLHRLALNLWREEGGNRKGVPVPAGYAFGAMPEPLRLCLFLSAYQGLEAREVARVLSCSMSEVERRLRAARMMLVPARADVSHVA